MSELLAKPGIQNGALSEVKNDSNGMSLAPTLLLLSDDELLVRLVCQIVGPPWRLVRHASGKHVGGGMFTQPNVRLVIFDDQAVEESDRGRMLKQIRKRFSGTPLLYIAATQTDANEKRARSNGAHYYVSKPLSPVPFGQVLSSFLEAQRTDRRRPNPTARRDV